MNFDEFRRRAAAVRAVPLETVLLVRGAQRDRQDRSKWHTERGPLSVTGWKFMNWRQGQGGGGAIDLVMHLAAVDCGTAMEWLEQHVAARPAVAGVPAAGAVSKELPSRARPARLNMPVRDDRLLPRVREYLVSHRRLSPSHVEPLIACGKLYADSRANAVFVLVAGKSQRAVGTELRGTGPRPWRGMAPGTCKDAGYFWIGVQSSRDIVLCESAIDAISCFQLHPERICISTSGARSNPPWLRGLIVRGYTILCGFDADEPGDAAAASMLTHHPAINRLRPTAHDWNDVLVSRR